MSADNGIYVLESDGPEYRVIHAQAIENISSDPDETGFNLKELGRYFGQSPIFFKKKDADKWAELLKKEVLADDFCPILEYGINDIKFSGKFPGDILGPACG